MTEVSAALIYDGDRFLICQRPPNKPRGLLWELPGGKAESGESPKETAERECREELGIKIKALDEFAQVIWEYPDIKIRLTVFLCRKTGGKFELREHSAARWITPEEIRKYDFCPADAAIMDKISSVSKGDSDNFLGGEYERCTGGCRKGGETSH